MVRGATPCQPGSGVCAQQLKLVLYAKPYGGELGYLS